MALDRRAFIGAIYFACSTIVHFIGNIAEATVTSFRDFLFGTRDSRTSVALDALAHEATAIKTDSGAVKRKSFLKRAMERLTWKGDHFVAGGAHAVC